MPESGAFSAEIPARVRMRWGLEIALRDGVRLTGTLYLPKANAAPAPCIFSLTPYTVHRNHSRACRFAEQGFPFLIVDSRGRGNSQGEFQPFIQEGKDGFDIVEWIARQPFCNGKVAMLSSSYEGYVQWATAREFPPHLATIVPAVAVAPAVDFPMRSNIPYPYVMRWLTMVTGHTSQEQIFDDQEFWRTQFGAWFESGRAFKELDVQLGNASVIFQLWVSHPAQDDYWDSCRPTVDEFSRLDIPILTITGTYDSDQPGALHYYREHVRRASPEAAAKHYLVIGPWNHRGHWNGSLGLKSDIGGLTFGPAALIDAMQLHLEWYHWTMGNGPKPHFLRKQVCYYVAGAERWRYADTLESITAHSEPLYLDSLGMASQIFASGCLGEREGNGPSDTYTYDPRDTSIAQVESKLNDPYTLLRPTFPTDDPTDQTLVYAKEGLALFYHSLPFSQDTELSGFFKLTAWISIDQFDTDFMVAVYEITGDGRSILLTSDLMRARYRESLYEERLVQTHEPLRYDFDRFTFISRQIKARSRLRLVIGPVNSIFYQKNYNSGGVVAEESMKDARLVKVTLWHDSNHPSALYIPYGQRETIEHT
jgi:putative CocE/NonD family hydrolase